VKLKIIAVGARMPDWIDAGFSEYARRMPRKFAPELVEIRPEPRGTGKSVEQMLAAEAQRIAAAIPAGATRVACDERGTELTTPQFAKRLQQWQETGGDIVFLIGGPDGLARGVKEGAQVRMRLSGMTLPHGLARVLLAEQIYRAWSILHNHPYHRD
jgi:23S rRNA (pseudouridine1915-N3)-methyltransferase